MIRMKARLGDFERDIRAMARELDDPTPVARDFGAHVVRRTKKGMPSQDEASSPGGPPASHRGGRGLRGSVTHNVVEDGHGVEVGTPLIYGGVLHEGTDEYLGGPIRPKNAKALTIPISDKAKGRRARDFEDLFFVPAGPGAAPEDLGILALPLGDDDFEPMFALRTEVTIEPRPWLFITDEDGGYAADRFEEQLDKKVFD